MQADVGLRANVRLLGRVLVEHFQLANIAEQHHRLRRRRAYEREGRVPRESLEAVFARLDAAGVTEDELARTARDRLPPGSAPGNCLERRAAGAAGDPVGLLLPAWYGCGSGFAAFGLDGEWLDWQPQIQQSVTLRNPYVDPMNAIQVELLRAYHAGDEAASLPLLRSIAGIAAALRNTG